ncbi:MAG: hypothetical protein A2275_06800 [Bacteroidetes bacterium RIFOXYA12_FULL_35_11]|nr:MAG: hypothetical protein A2X01_15395 [Bacteroidetes bacterium GWF2_35_48]OFY76795.1 MAG: hypothetical protein A2275_06800 [Bacteroidetes bacterium RIFOXYA12_FULL_35_11]OFY98023.1 MAG: hypothetical protein A2491_18915 [Bacteroidetes bacterium RIFOXYC12_FULL_35_7]HBX49833.1 hypothetical protein [Bacteroidales bacterium]
MFIMTFNNFIHANRFFLVLIWLFLFPVFSLYSQPYQITIPYEFSSGFEKSLHKFSSATHTSVKPFNYSEITKSDDSLFTKKFSFNDIAAPQLKQRLLHEHWFEINKENYRIFADPLLNINSGMDLKNTDFILESSTGFSLKTDNKKNLAFSLDLAHHYSRLNPITLPITEVAKIFPGEGYAHKSGKFYEFTGTRFYAAYRPSQYFLFETGLGKHFIGDGYRSMLLSNNSYNYPYFKIEANLWKFKYLSLWTNFKDLRFADDHTWSAFDNKYGVFHYLDWIISKRLSLGFFEAIICKAEDSIATSGLDVNYFNPVIFFRPVEFSLGSPNNSLMGFNLKFKITEKLFVYGQYMIDDFVTSELKQDLKHLLKPSDSTINYGYWTNKQAYQVGFRYHDFLVKNLTLQAEWNAARPYTYSHRDVYQNYGHYNQALAHPAGANFKEGIIIINYIHGRFAFTGKWVNILTGLDSSGTHFGQNIYQVTFDSPVPGENNTIVQQYKNHIGQGVLTYIQNAEIKISYLINPKNNLRTEAGFASRIQNTSFLKHENMFFYIGLRTSIGNGVDY